MGRGRQKAKHTKVARELKYFSPDTNYGALEKELATKSDSDEYVDRWADDFDDDSEVDTDLDEGQAGHDQSKTA
ncbi:DUF3073 domain-containing protein [Frigoribacterium faeni]|uniref:DUF3073 domain-containing protein n=1 Tax=Frigoribacterium faeni TaxID=145483 RepID=UPI00141AC0C6|nr:DUF3073 domain-containing protein [Frigoribacterium faeni]NIJ06390.1 hypothetical protein [Frigoribacterium faeni]